VRAEVPVLHRLQQWGPRLRECFAGASWRNALAGQGYAVAESCPGGPAANTSPNAAHTLAVAPLLEHGKLRRSLELYLRELGIQVMSTGEQMAQLAQEGCERWFEEDGVPDRLLGYLSALGRRVDVLVVPLGAELAGAGQRVEVLATGLASASGRLPHVICVRCEESWRHFRANLIELGVTLTGDPRRAEVALDRAFALV
jgi:hypothetical protein